VYAFVCDMNKFHGGGWCVVVRDMRCFTLNEHANFLIFTETLLYSDMCEVTNSACTRNSYLKIHHNMS